MRAFRSLPLAITATLALTACGGSALSGGGSDGGGEDDTVTIGLLVPKSGVYAPLGEDMEAGFRLYLEQNDNQLAGKDVEVTVVDEGGGPDDGVPAGTKLAQDESIDAVVGIVNSAVALGLSDAFTEAKKPLIIANAGADGITGDSASDYVWRTSFSNSQVGAAMGGHVAEEVDGDVYLVGPDYAAGEEFLAGFKQTFEEAGGTIAGTQMTPFGTTTNFQPYLQKVRNADPDAVFAFYAGSEAVTFVKQYDSLGLHGKIPFYATGFLTEGGALDAQGKAAEGIFTSLHYSSELDNEKNVQFVKEYEGANNGAQREGRHARRARHDRRRGPRPRGRPVARHGVQCRPGRGCARLRGEAPARLAGSRLTGRDRSTDRDTGRARLTGPRVIDRGGTDRGEPPPSPRPGGIGLLG